MLLLQVEKQAPGLVLLELLCVERRQKARAEVQMVVPQAQGLERHRRCLQPPADGVQTMQAGIILRETAGAC